MYALWQDSDSAMNKKSGTQRALIRLYLLRNQFLIKNKKTLNKILNFSYFGFCVVAKRVVARLG